MANHLLPIAAAGLFALGAFSLTSAQASSEAVRVPPPAIDAPAAGKLQTAILAGGCFWGVQGVYAHVDGVQSAVSGYAGGTRANANYDAVSGGGTKHAEVVRVVYDPAKVSYGTLLRIFFSVVADPTTKDYQGPDRGSQYRTAIFPTTPDQAKVARAYIAQLGSSNPWKRPIVTTIEPVKGFFPAEAYHQDYLFRNPNAAYIRINDAPKIAALKSMFPQQYRARPVLVAAR